MNLIKNIIQETVFLKEIANRVLELCKCSQESEISIVKTTGITVSTRYGEVENIEFDNNEELEVTVFIEKKKGTASSNNLGNNAVLNAVDTAKNIARYTSSDLCSGIADKELLAFNSMDLDLCHPINLDIKFGINLASQAEQTALKYDNRIICTEGGKFSSHVTTKVFGNSHGMLNSYHSSQYMLSCGVIAESNGVMEQNYAYTLSRSLDSLQSPEWIGQECARRTLSHLDSKKIKTMESKVLFASEIATSLFKHLANAIHGNNVYRRSTFLSNKLKQNIFPSWISIRELPHIPKAIGSAPFDNEGVQTTDHMIIENGVLNNWLLDSYSARKIGLKSTGNSGGIYNWYITFQDINFLELIKSMHQGLIVTNLMGQGVNIITGDYSRGVSGFWVDDGEIKYPVHEITISGNLQAMFSNIIAISNDIETRDTVRCGSVLIDSMKISGI